MLYFQLQQQQPEPTALAVQEISNSPGTNHTSLLTDPTHGLTLMHQGAAADPAMVDGVLGSTPSGGVILPSGDIHSGQNGIYTVIPSENSSLLFSNPVASASTSRETVCTNLVATESGIVNISSVDTGVDNTTGVVSQAHIQTLQLQGTEAGTLISQEDALVMQGTCCFRSLIYYLYS